MVAGVGDDVHHAGSRATPSSAARRCGAAPPVCWPAARRSAPTATPAASASARRLRPLHGVPGRQLLRLPEGLSPRAAASPNRSPSPCTALPRRRVARRPCAGVRGRPDRRPHHRRPAGPGRRRRRLRRAQPTAPALAEAAGAASGRHRRPRAADDAEPGRVVDGAVDVALECSGKARRWKPAPGQLRRGGTLVLVGAGIEPPRFDPNRILLNELVITGAFVYDADGFGRALAPARHRPLPIDALARARRRAPRRPPRRDAGLAEGRLGRKGPGAAVSGPAFPQAPAPQPRGHVGAGRPARREGRDGDPRLLRRRLRLRRVPTMTEDRKRSCSGAHTPEQFVFLIAEDQPMTAPPARPLRPVGGTKAEFDEVARRAAAWKAAGARRGRPLDPTVEEHAGSSGSTASTCATGCPSWWRPSSSSGRP